MNQLTEKISSYNLFNNLLLGTVYSYDESNMMGLEFNEKSLFICAFLFSFLGLVISRFGSIVIEPKYKKTGFLKFVDYPDYAPYEDRNIIGQNSAKDITFECEKVRVHVYESAKNYSSDFLDQDTKGTYDNCVGTQNILKKLAPTITHTGCPSGRSAWSNRFFV